MTETAILVGLLVIATWGAWIGRRLRLIEFFSNRGRGSTRDIFFTLIGSLVGGYMFFGLTAIAYEVGTVAAAIGIGYCVGLILLCLAVPTIKRAMDLYDCDTMDDFLGSAFGPGVQRIVSIINFLFFIAVVAAQFIAMISYLRIVAPKAAIWLPPIAALLVIAYTAIAGYKGVILTDIPQTLVLGIGGLLLLVVLAITTDSSDAQDVLNSHLIPTGYGIVFLVGVIVLFPLTLLARSDLWQRIAHAKNAKTAQKGFLLTIPVLFLFYCLFTAIGTVARIKLGAGVTPESSGIEAFVTSITSTDTLSPIIGKVFLAVLSLGIYAALLSTSDTNLNIGSVALTKMLYQKQWKSWSSNTQERFRGEISSLERAILLKTRIISTILGLAALALAYLWPNIIDIMVACAAVLMVFLPSVLFGLFRKHKETKPAFLSILLGLVAFVVFAMTMSNYKISFVPAGLISLLVYLVTNIVVTARKDH